MLDRLDFEPKLQQQPCNYSCVPTCIAMAFGVPVADVIGDMELIGYKLGKGFNDRQTMHYLSTHEIGAYPFMCGQGQGIVPGHFLASLPSKNILGVSHSILIHYADEMITVYDPNNGREGFEWWSTDSWGSMGISSFLYIDDWRDLP